MSYKWMVKPSLGKRGLVNGGLMARLAPGMISGCVSGLVFGLALIVLPLSLAQAKDKFKSVTIDEVDASLKKKSPLFIFDANGESTRAKVGLVPTAVPLTSSSDYDVKATLPPDHASALVFYCANTMCTASHEAAERAIEAGYTNVSVMKEGIYGWQKAGKTLAKWMGVSGGMSVAHGSAPGAPTPASQLTPKEANALVEKKNAVIVDVREAEERHEIVGGSLWFPISKISDGKAWEEFKSHLPKGKKVIFHCYAGKRAKVAADKLGAEGVSTAFFKGPDEWKAAGLPLTAGPAH
jgi:rhodanese-related sulfurtransferase